MPHMTYWKCYSKRLNKTIYKAVDEVFCEDYNYKEHMRDQGWKQMSRKEWDER